MHTHTHTHTYTQAKTKIIGMIGGNQNLEQLTSEWSTFRPQNVSLQLPDQDALSDGFMRDPKRKRKSVLDQFLVDDPYADIPEFRDALARTRKEISDAGAGDVDSEGQPRRDGVQEDSEGGQEGGQVDDQGKK
jgi:hypothetical protein